MRRYAIHSNGIRALVALVGAIFAVLLAAPMASAAPVAAHPAIGTSPSIPGIPDCKDAPTAQLPGTGLPGLLDPGPKNPPPALDPWADNPQTSVYEQYGYAGLHWNTYDLGCGGSVRDMGATIDTTAGNAFLSMATWLASATNGLHNKVAHPSEYMAPLDDIVATVSQRIHEAVWSPWGGAALMGVVILLLLYSLSGRLSSVASAAAWAILVLTVMAGIAQYPTRVSQFFDDSVTSTIASINTSSAGLSNVPDSSDPGRAQGALLVDRIVYDAWVRGEFGSADSEAAKTWAPSLYKASAFTWKEAADANTSAKAKDASEAKAKAWKDTTSEIQDKDPLAYAAVQGKSGGRAGTGLMAFFGVLFTALFRLVADIFMFAGLVMLRLLVMLFPAVAVVGVMAPMASIVRRVANMAGASVVNVVAFAAGSAVHTTAISAILSRAQSAGMTILALVLCLVVTLAAFVLLYPLLSLTNLLGRGGGSSKRLLSRVGQTAIGYVATREAVEAGAEDADEARSEKAGRFPGREMARMSAPSESYGRPNPGSSDAADPFSVPSTAGATTVEKASPARGSDDPAVARPADGERPAGERSTAGRPAGKADGGVRASGGAPDSIDAPTSARLPGARRAGGADSERQAPAIPDVVALPVHDSQTEVRPDGVGPRIYDPETKATVLEFPRKKAVGE